MQVGEQQFARTTIQAATQERTRAGCRRPGSWSSLKESEDVMSVGESRNETGLARLRDRYVTRARYLAKSTEFPEVMRKHVRAWNEGHPDFRIDRSSFAPTTDEIDANRGGFVPSDLQSRHARAHERQAPGWNVQEAIKIDEVMVAWMHLVDDGLSEEFFPSRYFFNPHLGPTHPSALFVSACLVFPPEILGGVISEFFPLYPHFTLHPRPQYKARQIAIRMLQLEGERLYLRSALRQLLEDRPDLLEQLEQEAERFMWKHVAQGVVPEPWEVDFWYLPIYPQISAEDIRGAASWGAQIAAKKYGADPVNQMIRELREDDQMSQQKIADLLGVSRDTVQRALK